MRALVPALTVAVFALLSTADGVAQGGCTPGVITLMPGSAVGPVSSLSGDGRYLAFTSVDATLVPNDTNGTADVFVYDRSTCAVERVSVNSNGVEGNSISQYPSISDDGNVVAFTSLSLNLVAGETESTGETDIFVRNRQAGTTVRASSSSLGVRGNGESNYPAISGDGTAVAFWSRASNLVAGDTNNEADIFVFAGGTTTRVSVDSSGAQGVSFFNAGFTGWPALSTDGRYVAFDSEMNNLVPVDGNNVGDVFRHDRQTGATIRVSIASNGLTQGNAESGSASISGNGRYVAFASAASTFVGDDTNGQTDVFVNDTATGTLTRVSVGDQGVQGNAASFMPSINGDGRYIAFASWATNLVPGDTNAHVDILVRDRLANTTRRVTLSTDGTQTDADAWEPDLSADGLFVSFRSNAQSLAGPNASNLFLLNWPALTAPLNLLQNPGFAAGMTGWQWFAAPYAFDIAFRLNAGLLEFNRGPQTPGTPNQAVVFQQSGLALPSQAPLVMQFDLGNTDDVRKRISVLVHDSDFTDLSVCTFWLPGNAPLRTYRMRTHTTKAWSNATISFYAATPNALNTLTGFYQLDNVTMQHVPAESATETACPDPLAPTAPGGSDGPNLLVNGGFGSGATTPGWNTFGQLGSEVNGGVFEFIKLAGTPAGVLLQPTGQAVPAAALLTSTFDLGNSSGVRKRVTVLLHDGDFSDLSACTFWLAPGQPLLPYAFHTYTTTAWTNATLSVYPATVGAEQWIRLDNVTLARTPTAAITGTECIEPAATTLVAASLDQRSIDAARASASAPQALMTGDALSSVSTPGTIGESPEAEVTARSDWKADGFTETGEPSPVSTTPSWMAVSADSTTHTLTRVAPIDLTTATSTRLTFQSWLSSTSSRALMQVSIDGVTWDTIHAVMSSDTWVPIEVDLRVYAGSMLRFRFLFETDASTDASESDTWRLDPVAEPR